MGHLNADFDYDLLVLGAGSGGLAAAQRAVQMGAKVAIAERDAVGGTCVNRGCIPKKLMVYAANFVHQQQTAAAYGWVNPKGLLDWPNLRQLLQTRVEQLQKAQAEKLKKAGIDLLRADATFIDAHRVALGEQIVSAAKLIIAVGSQPILPDLPGIEQALTSRQMFSLEALPRRLMIVGGGYIGAEFGHICHALGSEVTLADSSEAILPGFDFDLRQRLQQHLQQQGIQILTETPLKGIQSERGGYRVQVSGREPLVADAVLCAVGRKPALDGLDLDAAGVETAAGAIAIGTHYQTSQPHICAVGDCIDRLPLTPVAKAEGRAAADWLFDQLPHPVDYDWVPSAVFTYPQAAAIGLTESAARQQRDDIRCSYARFQPLHYSPLESSFEALIKVVVDQTTERVVGVHIVAPRAAEMVQMLAPALRQGLTQAELSHPIGIHPTLGEELFNIST